MQEHILQEKQEEGINKKLKGRIDDVRTTILQTTMDFHNYIFPKYINNYKQYLGFVADRLKSIEYWQSNINYPVVSSAIDTMFSNLFDFGYEIGVSEENLKKACIKSFDFRNNGKNTLKEVTKEALILGKAYARDYFIREEFEEVFFGKEISYDIKMPSMQYLSAFDVLYDRNKGIKDSPYQIVRTFVSGKAIKDKVFPIMVANKTKEERDLINKKLEEMLRIYKQTRGSMFSRFDYNPVKHLTEVTLWFNSDSDNTYYALSHCNKTTDLNPTINDEMTNNYFLNTLSSTYELVEYYEGNEKYIFVNGFFLWYGKIERNISKIREANFSVIPGTGTAMGMTDKLSGFQSLQNSLLNAYIDNIKLVLAPMFEIRGNIPTGKDGVIDFKAFKGIRTNGQASITKMELGTPNFTTLNTMQYNDEVASRESGMNNYINGGVGSVERVQGGVDLRWNQYKSRLTPLSDSIDQMMGDITRSWIMMFLKFYTKDELLEMNIDVTEVYTTNDEGKSKFKTFEINGIDIKDILDEQNINFTYNSLDKITKENSRQIIIDNFQFFAQYIPNKINMDEMAKVFSGKDFDPLNIFLEGESAGDEEETSQMQLQSPEVEPQPEGLQDEDMAAALQNIIT